MRSTFIFARDDSILCARSRASYSSLYNNLKEKFALSLSLSLFLPFACLAIHLVFYSLSQGVAKKVNGVLLLSVKRTNTLAAQINSKKYTHARELRNVSLSRFPEENFSFGAKLISRSRISRGDTHAGRRNPELRHCELKLGARLPRRGRWPTCKTLRIICRKLEFRSRRRATGNRFLAFKHAGNLTETSRSFGISETERKQTTWKRWNRPACIFPREQIILRRLLSLASRPASPYLQTGVRVLEGIVRAPRKRMKG